MSRINIFQDILQEVKISPAERLDAEETLYLIQRDVYQLQQSYMTVSAEKAAVRIKPTLTDCCIVLSPYTQHVQIQLKLPFTQQMLPLARALATNKSFQTHTFKRRASPGTRGPSASVCARHDRSLGSRPMGRVFRHR